MSKRVFDTITADASSPTGQDGIVTLGRYLDGLTISVYGRLYDQVLQELDDRQKQQWNTVYGAAPVSLSIPIQRLSKANTLWFRDYGHDGYKYHLDNEYLDLRLSGKGSLPNLRIKFKAPLLYHMSGSLPDLGDTANEICVHFLEEVQSTKVSECAVAVDFQGGGMQIPQAEDAVRRTRRWTTDGEGSIVSGLTIGKRSKNIEFQIYNKSLEIVKSKKPWMRKFWSQHRGYSKTSTVHRAELRFRREALGGFKKLDGKYPTGIDTIQDLEEGMGDLLRYAIGDEIQGTKGWLRFCTPESRQTKNGNKTRSSYRPTAAWWKTVASEFVYGTAPSGRVRIRPGSSYSPEHTREMLCAYALKLAAELYIDDPEHPPSVNDLITETIEDEFYSILDSKGITWKQAVKKEANELQRKGYVSRNILEDVA